jgi:hypothetical protein
VLRCNVRRLNVAALKRAALKCWRSNVGAQRSCHPVFDLSMRGQVPGNVSVILTVPSAVFLGKTLQ